MTTKSIHLLIEETRANLQALERVAALMNGHLTAKAQATLPLRLEKAITMRQQAQPKRLPGSSQFQRKLRREEILRTALTDAPRGISELQRILEDHGESLSKSGILNMLKDKLHVRKHGGLSKRTYSLPATTHAEKAEANGSNNGHGDKLPVLLDVLSQRGPLRIKDLVKAVKLRGYDGPLTGIHNYVKAGWLTRTKNGKYKFKARPAPESSDAQPTDQSTN